MRLENPSEHLSSGCSTLLPTGAALASLFGRFRRRSDLQFARTLLGEFQRVDHRNDNGADGSGHLKVAITVATRHGNCHEQDVQRLQLAPRPADECTWKRLLIEDKGWWLAVVEVRPNRVGVIWHGARAVSAVHAILPTMSQLRGSAGVCDAKPRDEAAASPDAMTIDAPRSASFDTGTAAHTDP